MAKSKGYKKYNDYIYELQEQFPEFSIDDLDSIIKFGSRNLYKMIFRSADIFFISKINNQMFKLIFGKVNFPDITSKIKYILRKMSVKFKILYKRRKIKWDGYYYFGLTESQFENYESQMSSWFKDPEKKRRRYRNTKFNYGTVTLFKLYDECKLNYIYTYFFRVPMLAMIGHKQVRYNYSTNKAEYIAKRTIDGYESMIHEYKTDKLREY